MLDERQITDGHLKPAAGVGSVHILIILGRHVRPPLVTCVVGFISWPRVGRNRRTDSNRSGWVGWDCGT